MSHVEVPVFWVQRKPEEIPASCAGIVKAEGDENAVVGDCVMGMWEGDWYRGVVLEEKGLELNVQFVDWGNSATLARGNVRLSVEGEMVAAVGAVKCKLVEEEGKGWEEEHLTKLHKEHAENRKCEVCQKVIEGKSIQLWRCFPSQASSCCWHYQVPSVQPSSCHDQARFCSA